MRLYQEPTLSYRVPNVTPLACPNFRPYSHPVALTHGQEAHEALQACVVLAMHMARRWSSPLEHRMTITGLLAASLEPFQLHLQGFPSVTTSSLAAFLLDP